jgi:hypothetical protein
MVACTFWRNMTSSGRALCGTGSRTAPLLAARFLGYGERVSDTSGVGLWGVGDGLETVLLYIIFLELIEREGKEEWTVRGSNPRPPECDSGALPAELTAH